jgi:hypothetical protein
MAALRWVWWVAAAVLLLATAAVAEVKCAKWDNFQLFVRVPFITAVCAMENSMHC